tara:strand:+ start:3950 stop:4132 length:183 start_codon:yes stop_codon:yes gene_type:complete
MKIKLLEILVCPTCKGKLELNIKNTESKDDENIIEGTLICKICPTQYEIKNSIPNLMPYK